MIKSRDDLKCYLEADGRNYWHIKSSWIKRMYAHLFTDSINDQTKIWSYIYNLRHLEYHINNKGIINKIGYIYYAHKVRQLSRITGFQISPNTCGKGLTIWHFGTIIVNANAKIGDYATFPPPLTIGHTENGGVPVIGDHVTINGGASVVGEIEIGDNVIIAPNAAVVKSVPSNVVVGGIPAKIIKEIS